MKTEETFIPKHQTSQQGFFTLLKKDVKTGARLGMFKTPHGVLETPTFMPCGTQGTVKALSSEDLWDLGFRLVLSNAYHLYLRPGEETLKHVGGLHAFMHWKGAILTDSGGYQLLSLASLRKITDEGISFQSHIDGSKQFLQPEEIIRFQVTMGSDIVMVLDECVGYPAPPKEVEEALRRTVLWAKRSKEAFLRTNQAPGKLLFGIVQGGVDPKLRQEGCEELVSIGFDGYAIGGLGVGEPKELLSESCRLCTAFLPEESPRYLMGIGTPGDILENIGNGVDLFDCVLPTRHGRNGQAFTFYGTLNLKNAVCARDAKPIDTNCACPACQGYSRAYLHHLLKAKEILGVRLLTLHNVWFYLQLMKASREAIQDGRFQSFQKETLQQVRSHHE